MKKGAAGALDVEIGQRIRARRLELGLSQEGVAEALGITFQQLQKYEKGANRVSAVALYRLAQILEIASEDLLPSPEQEPGDRKSALSANARKFIDGFNRLGSMDQRAVISAIAASFANAASFSEQAASRKKTPARKKVSKRPR